MREFHCVLMDVFTSQRLEGNQLAVFTDARGLSNAEMQALARETNLAETTFILPREAAVERESGIKVRIFTVQEELPFAGHPTLGTATVLRGKSGAAKVELDLKVGKIPVTFEDRPGGHFFGAQHTLQRYSTAFYAPLISDWRNFQQWQGSGSPQAWQKANELWKRALAEYSPPPLDPAIAEEVEAFIARRIEEGGEKTDI